MKKKGFISPFVLFVVFSVMICAWISIYLHATIQFPQFHIVEKVTFSAYFTMIGMIAISIGFGLLVLVFSGVFWAVQKLLGVEQQEADDWPVPY